MVIPTHIAEKGAAPSFREREETRRFYTETLLHTESFTHKHFYTQTLSHRDVFHAHTHKRISTQRLLHENTLTHRRFYTQTLLHTYAFTCRCLFTDAHTLSHTNAFTHRRFCTQTQTLFHTDPFTHRRFYTQTLLHTYAFTHGRFYTQTLLHTGAFTHRRFYTQTLLHTDAFPHRPFYTQTLLHTNTFTHRRFHRDFYTETLTKRGTTGWPQLQTKVRKHSCNGNAKKSQKCTRPGSVPWSTLRWHWDHAFTNIQRTYKNMDVHSVHNASCLYVHVWAQERGKEVNYACRCRVAQSTAKHLLSDFQTENTTHEFDMTKNHCRRDLQTEGWTHQQKTSLTKFGNTIWNHLAMPCFILHHPGLPNWEHNSWVWHLGWASLSNTMML